MRRGFGSALRSAKMRARLLRRLSARRRRQAVIAADPLYAHVLAMVHSPLNVPVPDDAAICALCFHDTSLAMLATHLEREHGIDAAEIANAPVIDNTDDV